MYYDIKEIKYTISKSGGRMNGTYNGSVGFKRPSSQYEAEQMAASWLTNKYPGWEIINLQVTLK